MRLRMWTAAAKNSPFWPIWPVCAPGTKTSPREPCPAKSRPTGMGGRPHAPARESDKIQRQEAAARGRQGFLPMLLPGIHDIKTAAPRPGFTALERPHIIVNSLHEKTTTMFWDYTAGYIQRLWLTLRGLRIFSRSCDSKREPAAPFREHLFRKAPLLLHYRAGLFRFFHAWGGNFFNHNAPLLHAPVHDRCSAHTFHSIHAWKNAAPAVSPFFVFPSRRGP